MYRSLSADDTNKNDNEVDYVFNNVKAYSRDRNDLKHAQLKIKQLEDRIAELDNRLPKKYDEVKFLNYQNRKRILVSRVASESLCHYDAIYTFRSLAVLVSLDHISSIT